MLVVLSCSTVSSAASIKTGSEEVNQYFETMACDYARGFNNVSRSPLEIYNAEKEYEQKKLGRPVIRNIAALTDGSFKMIERLGSGLWDFLAGVLLGEQDGIPPKPEMIPIQR